MRCVKTPTLLQESLNALSRQKLFLKIEYSKFRIYLRPKKGCQNGKALLYRFGCQMYVTLLGVFLVQKRTYTLEHL